MWQDRREKERGRELQYPQRQPGTGPFVTTLALGAAVKLSLRCQQRLCDITGVEKARVPIPTLMAKRSVLIYIGSRVRTTFEQNTQPVAI